MGMSTPLASDAVDEPDRRYVRHSREYLASQQWTADRVRAELVDDRFPAPRYEFLDGTLLVSPSPEPRHQHAVVQLILLLAPYVERHGLGFVLTSPSDVEVAPNTTAQPDVFVVPPSEVAQVVTRGHRPLRALTLAVEVLSPSSGGVDRLRKRRFYAARGVPEYWVVDLDAWLIEVSRPDDARVELYDAQLAWHPSGAPEPLVLDVAAYFARVNASRPDDTA